MSGTAAVRNAPKLTLVVVHNGVARNFDAPETAALQSVLSRAMAEFGVSGSANYALFTEANVELNAQASLREAGIVNEQKLVLRARTVRAGACRT